MSVINYPRFVVSTSGSLALGALGFASVVLLLPVAARVDDVLSALVSFGLDPRTIYQYIVDWTSYMSVIIHVWFATPLVKVWLFKA